MNKLLLVAAMIISSMAVNLKSNNTQKSGDFATVSNFATVLLEDGMKMMKNAALAKDQKKMEHAPIEDSQFVQLPKDDLEQEVKSLHSLADTKVIVFGHIFTVEDWTILIIVVAFVVVLTTVLIVFCCCFDSKEKPEEMMEKMEEKKEMMEEEKMMMEPEMMAAE